MQIRTARGACITSLILMTLGLLAAPTSADSLDTLASLESMGTQSQIYVRGGDTSDWQIAACNILLAGSDVTNSSAVINLSKCSHLKGTIYVSAIVAGSGVNQTSFGGFQDTFESLLSESIQDGLDASAVVLNTHSHAEGALNAEIALLPIDFSDLHYWRDALSDEGLADDLAEDMTSLGLPIDNITYTAKFAFGIGLDNTSMGILPLQHSLLPSGIDLGNQFANHSVLCDFASEKADITSLFPWPCHTPSDDLEFAARAIFCNTLLQTGMDAAANCGGVSGSVQVTVLLHGNNYPLTAFDRQSLGSFMSAELSMDLPPFYAKLISTRRVPKNVTSTSAVLQLAPVDYSGFNEFSLALSAYPLADNLLIDLLFIGINADNLTLGEPTFQYGSSNPSNSWPDDGAPAAPRASEEDQSAAAGILFERLQHSVAAPLIPSIEGYTSFLTSGATVSLAKEDNDKALVNNLIEEYYQKKQADSKAEDKAEKDTRKNLGKAAAVAVRAVTKDLDSTTDPRAAETLTSSIVGGIAALVATIYGGPLAGYRAQVAASAVVTYLFNYQAPYKVQDLSKSIMLNEEQRRLIDVVSNNQANMALFASIGYDTNGQIVRDRPLYETQVLHFAKLYTDSVQSCKRVPPPQDCVTNALTCLQLGCYLTKLGNAPSELYSNGTLASYVSYQALNLVALQGNAISFNSTCPGKTRSLSEQFASLRLFQDSVRTAKARAQHLANASFAARKALLVYSTDAVFQPYKGDSVTTPADDSQGFPQDILDRLKRGNIDPTLFTYLPTRCSADNGGLQLLQALANDRLKFTRFSDVRYLGAVPVYGLYNPDGTLQVVQSEGRTYSRFVSYKDLAIYNTIPESCKMGFFSLVNGFESFYSGLSNSCIADIKKHWNYTCSYCSNFASPPFVPYQEGRPGVDISERGSSSGVQTNGVLVNVKWVDYYSGKQRQYVECRPPTVQSVSLRGTRYNTITAAERKSELLNIFAAEASQALVNVDTTNNASLASLVTWPADPGQINDYFYYRIPSQVPIYTESNFQGSVGEPLEKYYIAPADLLATQVDTGNMLTNNITTLSIAVDQPSGFTRLRSLAVTYDNQKTYLIGGTDGSAIATILDLTPSGNLIPEGTYVIRNFTIGAGDFINSTTLTYGFVPHVNATVINAIGFTTMTGAAYMVGQADLSLRQTRFPGILKGFKGYGKSTIAALGFYTIT